MKYISGRLLEPARNSHSHERDLPVAVVDERLNMWRTVERDFYKVALGKNQVHFMNKKMWMKVQSASRYASGIQLKLHT